MLAVLALALSAPAAGVVTPPSGTDAADARDTGDAARLIEIDRYTAHAPLGAGPVLVELGSPRNTGPTGRLPDRVAQNRAAAPGPPIAPPAGNARARMAVSRCLDFSARLALLRSGLTGWHSTAPPPVSV